MSKLTFSLFLILLGCAAGEKGPAADSDVAQPGLVEAVHCEKGGQVRVYWPNDPINVTRMTQAWPCSNHCVTYRDISDDTQYFTQCF